ncbi:MAG: hypothetical protein M0Z60_01790, partial [Nitrospiraceae bacterium]|nr:hypothetical protein [Nitrospiraceae bacterium]
MRARYADFDAEKKNIDTNLREERNMKVKGFKFGLLDLFSVVILMTVTPLSGYALTISGDNVGIPPQTLEVNGNAQVNGNQTVSGNLSVNGSTNFSGLTSFTGSISGNTTITGNVTLNGAGSEIIFPDGSIQTTASGHNPLRVALLRWYNANKAGNTFTVGTGPSGIAFDGAN